MKRTIYLFAALVLTLIIINEAPLFAQQNFDKDFIGVWELDIPKQKASNGREFALVHFVKVFNADGSFCNLNLNPENSVISHKGVYGTDKDGYYESITTQNIEFVKVDLSKAQKLNFHFSDDKKILYLVGVLKDKNGNPFTLKEAWKKLDTKL